MPKRNPCTVDGCDKPAWRKGMCGPHVREATPKKECDEPGCEKESKSLKGGPCTTHKTRRERAAAAQKVCTIEGCDRPQYAKSLCIGHYVPPAQTVECSVEGCEQLAKARGMCATHERHERMGRPDAARCSIEGCESPVLATELCTAHYQKQRRWGDPLHERVLAADTICSVEDCGRQVVHSGLCNRHMLRNRRHGDPRATELLIVAEIKREHVVAPEGHHVAVWSYYGRETQHILHDPEDCDLVCEDGWYVSPMGYAMRWVQSAGKAEFLHRRIMGLGFLTDMSEVVDHANGVTTDNRRCNLRVVTQGFNIMNQATVNNRGSSRYRGVSWDSARQRWAANVRFNNVNSYLGLFSSEELAAKVVKEFRERHGIPEYGPAA